MPKKPTAKSLLANTFIAEALEVIAEGEHNLPDMDPLKEDDIVLGQMTDLEKALVIVATKASLKQKEMREHMDHLNGHGKGFPLELLYESYLLEQKSEFAISCAWFLIYQRLNNSSGRGIYIRKNGTLVSNEKDTQEETKNMLLGVGKKSLPLLLGSTNTRR